MVWVWIRRQVTSGAGCSVQLRVAGQGVPHSSIRSVRLWLMDAAFMPCRRAVVDVCGSPARNVRPSRRFRHARCTYRVWYSRCRIAVSGMIVAIITGKSGFGSARPNVLRMRNIPERSGSAAENTSARRPPLSDGGHAGYNEWSRTGPPPATTASEASISIPSARPCCCSRRPPRSATAGVRLRVPLCSIVTSVIVFSRPGGAVHATRIQRR